MTRHNSSPPTVSIGGVDLSRIEYRGEQVVTFTQVDHVHKRSEGTAGRVFRDNRARFVEGEDFVQLDQPDEIRRLGFSRPQGGTPALVTLITKRGYLKLVKPMSDDRAWAVQGEMVDRYFAFEQAAEAAGKKGASPEAIRVSLAREARLTFNDHLRTCKMLGITGSHALLAANQATMRTVGVDRLSAMGVKHLPPETDSAQINSTTLGQHLGGLSAQEANKRLIEYGYATAHRDAKGRLFYELTDKGRATGGRIVPTGKKHTDGTPVTQCVWSMTTVEALRRDMHGEAQ